MGKRINSIAMFAGALAMTGGLEMFAGGRKFLYNCTFCNAPIFSEAEHMPNPDCCLKRECLAKWEAARNAKNASGQSQAS